MTAITSRPNRSYEPRTGRFVDAPVDSSPTAVDEVVGRASVAASAEPVRPDVRDEWLNAMADALVANAAELTVLADEETALGPERLSGELTRCADALRFYGSVAAQGTWLDATVDRRPALDLRRVNRPLGVVAVFGASNFPFGFGVLGHDTATSIAAGCPVVAKAHPAHPRLSARLVSVAAEALSAAGAPQGWLGLVHGYDAGTLLVTHPDVDAVGFTGSQAGGLALWRLAAGRTRVIPVYAEMGTVNTVVVTSAAARAREEEIATGFLDSFTLGLGQFCTKPGLLLVPSGSRIPRLVAERVRADGPAGWMLSRGIADHYAVGVERLIAGGATVLARATAPTSGWSAAATVLSVPARALRPKSRLLEECFGPVAIVAEYEQAELAETIASLPGSLAAGVQAADIDGQVPGLVAALAKRCGRVLVNGWPTGVAVGWAQHHGGPWPATTSPASTSVGAGALRRWIRPVAFQGVPEGALPHELRTGNPWRIPVSVDGHPAA